MIVIYNMVVTVHGFGGVVKAHLHDSYCDMFIANCANAGNSHFVSSLCREIVVLAVFSIH